MAWWVFRFCFVVVSGFVGVWFWVNCCSGFVWVLVDDYYFLIA